MVFPILLAVIAVACGLAALWIISQRTPHGSVLAIAAVLFVSGAVLNGIRIKEVILVAGILKLLGFAGGILGIIDLVRRHKDASKPGPLMPVFPSQSPTRASSRTKRP